MTVKVEDVFGVSRHPVKSYYERARVDGAFQDALQTDKHIIVYGSSKQGKTSLVNKHLPYEQHIVVSLTPKYTIPDIYKSILRSGGIRIEENQTHSYGRESSLTGSAAAKVGIPLIADVNARGEASLSENHGKETRTSGIGFNFELPNDIAALLHQHGAGQKFIILENFHYLDVGKQNQLAYDLRSFQELGIRFVILGVWREKNHLTQFNGDLTDRIIEVPVEPWTKEDFMQVIRKGEQNFNVTFSEEVSGLVIRNAFDSIGVVQELLKNICLENSLVIMPVTAVHISNLESVKSAIKRKAEDYSLRHRQSLSSIAQGRKATHQTKTGKSPLFLANYTVRVFLSLPFDDLVYGITQKKLEAEIKRIHHRPDGIKKADMINLLDGFAELQIEKNIVPPIIDYDKASKTLRIVDSTLYFFLRNVNTAEILEDLPDIPIEGSSARLFA